jgi:hypothetical protein
MLGKGCVLENICELWHFLMQTWFFNLFLCDKWKCIAIEILLVHSCKKRCGILPVRNNNRHITINFKELKNSSFQTSLIRIIYCAVLYLKQTLKEKAKLNSVAWACARTILIEQLPLVGELSVPCCQRDENKLLLY